MYSHFQQMRPVNRGDLMKKVFITSMSLLLILAFISCSTNGAISDRILNLEKEFEIGIKEGNEKYIFGSIYDIEVDKLGNIYVLDSISSKIKKYNKHGEYVLDFGRSGQGPGEFGFPESMVLDSERQIYILDSPIVKIFNEFGDYIREFNSKFLGIDIALDDNENLILLGPKEGKIFHIFDRTGDFLFSFGSTFDIPDEFSKLKGMNLFRSPLHVWCVEDFLYVMNPYEYEINVYKDERLDRKIKRDSVDLLRPKFDEKIPGGFSGTVSDNLIYKMGQYLYVFYNGETANWLDIYLDGELIDSLQVSGILKSIDMSGKFYFVENEDFYKIVVYKIRWE